MADLVNLKEFDREFAAAGAAVQRLLSWRREGQNVWSGKQKEQFDKLIELVLHLKNAMSSLVHNNRDSRG